MAATNSNSQPVPGHSLFVTLLGEIIGVSILAIVADSSDAIGKIAVALMAGWLLIFLMNNASDLSTWTAKL
jgi:hypothetical protein